MTLIKKIDVKDYRAARRDKRHLRKRPVGKHDTSSFSAVETRRKDLKTDRPVEELPKQTSSSGLDVSSVVIASVFGYAVAPTATRSKEA
jgi:hypothetical protein